MSANCLVFVLFALSVPCFGQERPKAMLSKDSLYNENIKKSKLYGVYIPRDIDDALSKLMELTTEEARAPLVNISEEEMSRKLFFGLGRWMEYNWNFEEGSRFSHYLRQKGLIFTEDMTRFMLIIFHRHLTHTPLEVDRLALQFKESRAKKIKEEQDKMPVIHSEKKKIGGND